MLHPSEETLNEPDIIMKCQDCWLDCVVAEIESYRFLHQAEQYGMRDVAFFFSRVDTVSVISKTQN